MPSGGSWKTSQDTRTDVVLMADTTTPVTWAEGTWYHNEVNNYKSPDHLRISAVLVCTCSGVPGPVMV